MDWWRNGIGQFAVGTDAQEPRNVYMAAQSHLIVDEYFLIPGGIGIVVTAILYGALTKWDSSSTNGLP